MSLLLERAQADVIIANNRITHLENDSSNAIQLIQQTTSIATDYHSQLLVSQFNEVYSY